MGQSKAQQKPEVIHNSGKGEALEITAEEGNALVTEAMNSQRKYHLESKRDYSQGFMTMRFLLRDGPDLYTWAVDDQGLKNTRSQTVSSYTATTTSTGNIPWYWTTDSTSGTNPSTITITTMPGPVVPQPQKAAVTPHREILREALEAWHAGDDDALLAAMEKAAEAFKRDEDFVNEVARLASSPAAYYKLGGATIPGGFIGHEDVFANLR